MKIIPFSIVILMLLNLSGCAKPNYDEARDPASQNEYVLNKMEMNVRVLWDHRPTNTTDPATMVLEFFDPKDKSSFMDPADLRVKLWMPDMGHGSSPVTITRLSRGMYRMTNMYFTMAGLWEIRVGVQDENGVVADFTVQERL
ncbi:MAG: FixH family protein [Bdellovibrionaceae bacterium]|nr:FixH family protein [Pseudobdellovibrionaceae bacterium]